MNESLQSLIAAVSKASKRYDNDFYSTLRYYKVLRYLKLVRRGAIFSYDEKDGSIHWEIKL